MLNRASTLTLALGILMVGRDFQMDAVLTTSTKHCTRSSTVQAAITDPALQVLERLRSQDRTATVSARLEHFSNYAVGW